MSTENLEQPIQDQQPKAARSYNPFISPVNEKPYSQMNVNVDQQRMYAPIPEASVSGNVVDGNENAYNMLNGEMSGMSGGSSSGSSQPFNPAMNELSDKDKHESAEHLAKTVIDGYELLHVLGNNYLQISKKKISTLVSEGEIDLDTPVPYEYGKFIPTGELIEELNEQNKDLLSVSKEFKKEAIPLLTKIFKKRGAGITDEGKLGLLFGKDIFIKGIKMYQAKAVQNQLIDVMKEYNVAYKQNGSVPPPMSESTPTPPPPPTNNTPKSRKPAPSPSMDSDDFNFTNNEVVMDSTVQKHAVPESGKARLMAQRKREKEIEEAMKRAEQLQNPSGVSYAEAMQSKKTGKRGRKPKDYVKAINEAEIADAIVLSETKNSDVELNED